MGVAALLTLSAWALFAAYTFHAALPRNPLTLPGHAETNLRLLAPQSWKFFSRDPHALRVRGYVLAHGGRWRSVEGGARAQLANGFGWDRSSEVLARELELVASNLPADAYTPCKHAPELCLNEVPVGGTASNATPRPHFCGTVGVVLYRPRPWAWRNMRGLMTTRVARMVVAC
jgi:antimicrobial peptide system SdpA family protein